MKIILLLSVFFIGCGSSEDILISLMENEYDTKVSEDLKPYVISFFKDCEKYNKNNECRENLNNIEKVSFVEEAPEESLGYCVLVKTSALGVVAITEGKVGIKKSTFLSASEYRRKMIMYHELGHCILHYNHTPSGVFSILSPTLLEQSNMDSYEDLLVKSLFKGIYNASDNDDNENNRIKHENIEKLF